MVTGQVRPHSCKYALTRITPNGLYSYSIPTSMSTGINAKPWQNLILNNYLYNYTDPDVWAHPRLIINIESLMHVVLNNTKAINGGPFDLSYD